MWSKRTSCCTSGQTTATSHFSCAQFAQNNFILLFSRRTPTFSPSALKCRAALLKEISFCEKVVFGCENADSKEIKGYRISHDLNMVIFTVAPGWFTDQCKKSIDASDQWRLTTNPKAPQFVLWCGKYCKMSLNDTMVHWMYSIWQLYVYYNNSII